jgi:hypothetical protein
MTTQPDKPFLVTGPGLAALSRAELLRLQPAAALVADLRELARDSVQDRAATARIRDLRVVNVTTSWTAPHHYRAANGPLQ